MQKDELLPEEEEEGWLTAPQARSVWGDIFTRVGSVFPFAARIAVPAGLLTCVLKALYVYSGELPPAAQRGTTWLVAFLDMFRRNEDGRGGSTTNAYGSFLFILGFLSVFRTSQAYGRFWDGATTSHGMLASWWESFSYFAAFSNPDLARRAEVEEFRELLARLYSILSAAALATLRGGEFDGTYRLELIDATRVEKRFIDTLINLRLDPEVVFYWIQNVTADAVRSRVVDMPPPIVSRAYHELGKGMHSFKDAVKTASLPFPFPYSQTTLILLIIHACITPFVMVFWTRNIATAGLFCGAQVLIFWMLHAISLELENPFGCDSNDVPLEAMQRRFNQHLLLLTDPKVQREPSLAAPEEAGWAESSSFVFGLVPVAGDSSRRTKRVTEVHSPSAITPLDGRALPCQGSRSPPRTRSRRSLQRSPASSSRSQGSPTSSRRLLIDAEVPLTLPRASPTLRSAQSSKSSLSTAASPTSRAGSAKSLEAPLPRALRSAQSSKSSLSTAVSPRSRAGSAKSMEARSTHLSVPSSVWSPAPWSQDPSDLDDGEIEDFPTASAGPSQSRQ